MIKPGDRVTIYFERVEAEYNVEVVTVPQKSHEAWELKKLDGTIVYVQQYSKMIRSNPIPKAMQDAGRTASELVAGAMPSVRTGEEIKKP